MTAPPTTVEHCATQRTLAFAQSQGLATVTTLAVDGEGFLSTAAAAAAVTRHTVLLSLMHSNNEVGTLQDIASIVSAARGAADGNPHPLLVHVDASQSLGKVPVEGLPAAGADFITVAGHKLYAPKGIGALVACSVPSERMPAPLLFGGGQETGRRPGTEPVPCAVALGAACEAAGASLASGGRARLEALRAALLQGIAEGLGAAAGSAEEPHPFLTHGPAATERRLPNTLSIAFPGVAARELQAALAGKLAVSAGAACKEGGLASPSHVLTAMGVPAEVALSTVRCSVGKFTTLAQVQRAAELIVGAVTAIRKAAQRPPLALETDRLYMRDSQQLECDAVIVAAGRCEALEGSGGKVCAVAFSAGGVAPGAVLSAGRHPETGEKEDRPHVPLPALPLLLEGQLPKLPPDVVPSSVVCLLLDTCVFHPQGGGQPSDIGTLVVHDPAACLRVLAARSMPLPSPGTSAVVLFCSVDGDSAAAPSVEQFAGAKVTSSVHSPTRSLAARLHSAGHLLDLAMRRVGVQLVPGRGYHFPDGAWVAYEGAVPAPERAPLVERLNAELKRLVAEDVPTDVHFLSPSDADGLANIGVAAESLAPGLAQRPLRAVCVGAPNNGCVCGGTHVHRAGELGTVTVTKLKVKKGETRVSYTVSPAEG